MSNEFESFTPLKKLENDEISYREADLIVRKIYNLHRLATFQNSTHILPVLKSTLQFICSDLFIRVSYLVEFPREFNLFVIPPVWEKFLFVNQKFYESYTSLVKYFELDLFQRHTPIFYFFFVLV